MPSFDKTGECYSFKKLTTHHAFVVCCLSIIFPSFEINFFRNMKKEAGSDVAASFSYFVSASHGYTTSVTAIQLSRIWSSTPAT